MMGDFFANFRNLKVGLIKIYDQYVGILDENKYGNRGRFSCVLNNSTLPPQNVFMSDYSIIQNHINLISNKGKLILKKYSVISSGCTIIPGSHRLTVGVPFFLSTTHHINDDEGDIVIDEDCWIGAECILLSRVHIGRGAVIGAGSVVTKDIPPYAVAVGNPARIIATKFNLEQVLKHESILYPMEERMKRSELEDLFGGIYKGLHSIGDDSLKNDEKCMLESIREKIGMKNYSNDV